MHTLPLILLELRSIILPNPNASVAEMVYGINIRLPYHFFNATKPDANKDPEKLKRDMNDI